MRWEEGDADAGGIRIRYRVTGEGPTLVLMHATGFHGALWDPWVPELADRFRVVTLDQRGHGDSDKPAEGYGWEEFGDDVLAVIGASGSSGAMGMGHSAGAAALIFAEAARPGTFSKLVLMDPTLIDPEIRGVMRGRENPMAVAAARRRAVWNSREEMIGRLREGSPLAGWRDDFLRAYVVGGTTPTEDGSFALKCPPEIESKVYQGSSHHDGFERLSHLRCPTLLAVGTESPMWSGERGEKAAARLPDGELAVIEGGHFFPMENPEATLRRALEFLDG